MHLAMPVYNVVSITGQAHFPLYKVLVTMTNKHANTHSAVQEHSTKRNAEQAAIVVQKYLQLICMCMH